MLSRPDTGSSLRNSIPVKLHIFLFFSLLLPGADAWCRLLGSEDGISCPKQIQTSQKLTKEMSGWQERQLGQYSRALYMEVYRGEPAQEQALLPTGDREQSGIKTIIWEWPQSAHTEGIWLVCAYQNTRVTLLRKLPRHTARCTMLLKQDTRLAVAFISANCT